MLSLGIRTGTYAYMKYSCSYSCFECSPQPCISFLYHMHLYIILHYGANLTSIMASWHEKRFPQYWNFWRRKPLVSGRLTSLGRGFEVFFVVILNKQLAIYWGYWRFAIIWGLCDVTLMSCLDTDECHYSAVDVSCITVMTGTESKS